MSSIYLPSYYPNCSLDSISALSNNQLFALEELRMQRLDEIVKIIQRTYRACRGRAFVKKCIYASVGVFYGNKGKNRTNRYYEYIYIIFLFNKGMLTGIVLLQPLSCYFVVIERRSDTIFRPFSGDYIKFKGSRLYKQIEKTFSK